MKIIMIKKEKNDLVIISEDNINIFELSIVEYKADDINHEIIINDSIKVETDDLAYSEILDLVKKLNRLTLLTEGK